MTEEVQETEVEKIEVEAPVDETAQADDETEAAPVDDDAKKPAKGVQKRINELVAEREDAKRDRDYWRNLAIQNQQNPAQNQQQATPEQIEKPLTKPTIDAFDSDEEYYEALTDYKLAVREQEAQKATQQEQEVQQREQAMRSFQERAAQFAAENPDFESKVINNPSLQISQDVADAIMASEVGPQIAYELGNDPAKAATLSGMSPIQAAMELGKMEARLTSKPSKKTTAAPDPVKPITGGGLPSNNLRDDMSMEDWIAQRRKQLSS